MEFDGSKSTCKTNKVMSHLPEKYGNNTVRSLQTKLLTVKAGLM